MGQAQSNRTGSARRSTARDSISVISGGGSRNSAGTGARSTRRNGGEGVRRRSTNGEGLELWEISREEDGSCMMRLADRKERQPGRKAVNLQPVQSTRRTSENSHSVRSINRSRARRRKVYFYRMIALFVIVVCLVLVYQTTGAIYRMVHRERLKKPRASWMWCPTRFTEKRLHRPRLQRICSKSTIIPDPVRS